MKVALLLAVVALILAGCTGSESARVTFADVHGLAVDPNDPSRLYVATHHGLFRGVDAKDWAKVGTETMDLMGFSMHPSKSNLFYASGHPGRPTRDYTSLGVVKSTDAGLTWTTVALRNEADFHAMTISLKEPQNVWAFYYRNAHFYASTDEGQAWNHFAPTQAPPPINALASDASSASKVYAATAQGVWLSSDVGGTWAKVPGTQPSGPATAIATTKAEPNLIWAYYPTGGMMRSKDAGATWQGAASLEFGNEDAISAIALDPSTPTTLYAASGRGSVFRSTDEGATWEQIQRPAF